MSIQSEAALEAGLIATLRQMDYEYVQITEEDNLYANFKRQLEIHNKKQLAEVGRNSFTDEEFEKILIYLEGGTRFEKAKKLRDLYPLDTMNGQRIWVEFLNRTQWCQNEFQVSNQITVEGRKKCRYDVTILINGLPLVQIELKRRGVELKQAYNQIQRYHKTSFHGLFDYIQLFVISNGVNTRYFANNPNGGYKFTFNWTDAANLPFNELDKFAVFFLEKCTLGKIIGKYIVLHEGDKCLMVLRPYQFYAVEKILDRVQNSNDNGYIWHTTGAGKTLTSFKTAQLVSELDDVDKVMFVVDRHDLDTQTQSEYEAFEPGAVDGTDNTDELVKNLFGDGCSHFLEMSGGDINATELVAALINQKDNLIEGIRYALHTIDGSLSLMLMNENGIYCARDEKGRTPVVIGKKEDAFCASFESFAYKNLGYQDYKELGPGEIVVLTHKNCVTLMQPGKDMKICTFLWVYYGYPASSYEGISVEQMRYNCGAKMAERDNVKPDIVAGVPDSGIAHAVGYANQSGIPFSRPFIKYTPTWPRSFMPTIQSQRNLIAKMKLLAVEELIRDKSLLLIDDSIVRGTQLRETTEYLFQSGAKEVHIRPACPPLLYGCKYLNFSRSSSEMDLITRRVIERLENGNVTEEVLQEYTDPDSEKYEKMVDEICKELHFTSLRFNRLDDMLDAVGIEKCKLCTYCWDGKE